MGAHDQPQPIRAYRQEVLQRRDQEGQYGQVARIDRKSQEHIRQDMQRLPLAHSDVPLHLRILLIYQSNNGR